MKTGNTSRPTRVRTKYKLIVIALFVAGIASLGGYAHKTGLVGAAACTVPTTDNGTATLSLNVPATTQYTVWTRMMIPDTTKNAINIEIDGNTCYNVGGSTAIPANTWVWVNYQNGATSQVIRPQLTQGTHSIKYVGTNSGVMVDRIILASNAACTPTGTGDDCATGDATAPTVNLTAPANGASVTNSVTISADASDPSGIQEVAFKVDGTTVNTDTTSPYSYSWDSKAVANGSHSLTAVATDKAGNVGTSTARTVTVSNTLPCTGTPATPANLRATSTSFTSISLAWDASTPASGCVISGYKLYRDGTLVQTITNGTTFTDTNLAINKAYGYRIVATQSSGQESPQSGILSTRTQADTTAPSVPTNLAAPLTTANNVSLTWTASTDNVAVAGYYIFRNGAQVGVSSTASYTDTGLQPDTTYSYTVKSYDASGNQSAASSAGSFKTIQGTGANKGDLNGNGKVDLPDLSVLLSKWNQTGVPITQGDVNADGKVNLTDLSILLSNWGKSV